MTVTLHELYDAASHADVLCALSRLINNYIHLLTFLTDHPLWIACIYHTNASWWKGTYHLDH